MSTTAQSGDPVLGSRRWLLTVTAVLTALFGLSAWWIAELDAQSLPAEAPLLLLNTFPLLWIRRDPLVVVLVIAVAYPLWLMGITPATADKEGHLLQSLPALVALYAVGISTRPLWWKCIALVLPAWMMGAALTGLWPTDPVELSYVAVILLAAWALGLVIAGRRAYAAQLEDRTRELEAARQELAERAVAHERARIARELHDVVAHAMSVITVQAGVGGHLVTTRPEQAGRSLAVIERTGREAMAELRRMLTVLRDDMTAAGHTATAATPQPGLADLPALLATARDAGVVVTVETEGTPRSLPRGLDLTAYRLVQEALTNVVKHAPGARTWVRVRYEPDQIAVEIRDRGGAATEPAQPGYGLRGMAERVALYDGELQTVAEPDGFVVTARFPLEHEPATSVGDVPETP